MDQVNSFPWQQVAACRASCSGEIMGAAMGAIFGVTCIFAWFYHIFTCFSEGLWGFLLAGAIFFPIGIIHGAWLWFQ